MLKFQIRRLAIRFKVKHRGDVLLLRFERPARIRTAVVIKMSGPASFVIDDVVTTDGLVQYVCTHNNSVLTFTVTDLPGNVKSAWFAVGFDTEAEGWEVSMEMNGVRTGEFWNKMRKVRNGKKVSVIEERIDDAG